MVHGKYLRKTCQTRFLAKIIDWKVKEPSDVDQQR
jgi:hypothetical protein